MSEPRVSISQKELNTLRDSVQTLTAENEELKRKLERMNELLLNAQRARFGQSSEKRDYVMPNQLGLFNEAEAEQNAKEEEPTEETFTVKEHKRKKKRTVEELTEDLPVAEVKITGDEKLTEFFAAELRLRCEDGTHRQEVPPAGAGCDSQAGIQGSVLS